MYESYLQPLHENCLSSRQVPETCAPTQGQVSTYDPKRLELKVLVLAIVRPLLNLGYSLYTCVSDCEGVSIFG